MPNRWFARVILVTLVLAAAACGGKSPTSASGGKAVLRGVALMHGASVGTAPAVSASGRESHAPVGSGGGGSITVRVQEQITIHTTISANGTFELDDVPSGTFHVEFVDSTGTVIGIVLVTNVTITSEINLVVQIDVNVVVVIKLEVDGVEEHHDGEGHDDD